MPEKSFSYEHPIYECEKADLKHERVLTSDVLQRDGNTCRHLSRSAKSPVAELLISTDTFKYGEQSFFINIFGESSPLLIMHSINELIFIVKQ